MYKYTPTPAPEPQEETAEVRRIKARLTAAIRILLVLMVLISLGSCAAGLAYRASQPLKTTDGATWDPRWTLIGKKLGLDEAALPEGWQQEYNQEISVSDKMYMALYGLGQPVLIDYLDRDDKPAQRSRYDAGFYIMARGSGGEWAAQQDLTEWQEALRAACETWQSLPSLPVAHQEDPLCYTCFSYTFGEGQSEDYRHGVIACLSVSGWAFFFELDWGDALGWDRDEALLQLSAILDAMHYAV